MKAQRMLLRLIVILLLITVFVSETFGATTKSPAKSSKKSTTKSSNKSPTKSKNAKSKSKATTPKPITSLDCRTIEDAIHKCLDKPAQEKSLNLYDYYYDTCDVEATLKLLKKLKNKDCIKGPALSDIQAFVTLNALPEPLEKVCKSLTTKEKKTIKKHLSDRKNKKLEKEYNAIWDKLNKKMNKFSKAEEKICDDWHANVAEVCGYEYSGSGSSGGSYSDDSNYYSSYDIYSSYY